MKQNTRMITYENEPYRIGRIRCGTNDQSVKRQLSSMPSYPINRRLYMEERIAIRDFFQIGANDDTLFLRLFYDDVNPVNRPLHQRHLIVWKHAKELGVLHTVDIEYHIQKPLSIRFHPAKIQPSLAKVEKKRIKDGYEALLQIPMGDIPLSELRFNIIRIDHQRAPITSFFPIANGFFNETADGTIATTLLLDAGGHMACMSAQKEAKPILQNIGIGVSDGLRMHLVCDTQDGICIGCMQWMHPDQHVQTLEFWHAKHKRTIEWVWDMPRPVKPGLHRLIVDTNHGRQIFCFDRRALIEAANDKIISVQTIESTVSIDEISKKAKELMDIIPPFSGICNACDPMHTKLFPFDLFSFDMKNPWKIRSKQTGVEYPNENFKEDKEYVVYDDTGGRQAYPYHETEDGTVCMFTPALWGMQKKAVVEALPSLAQKDPGGAVWVLKKLVDRYPHYVPYSDYYHKKYPMRKSNGPPYPYNGGLWTSWFYGNLKYAAMLAEALSIIECTDALDKIEKRTGKDLKTAINAMIDDTIDFVESYGIQNSNMDAVVWEGLVRLGRARNDPDLIHEALERMDVFIKSGYLFDGFWKEVTVSYHMMTVRCIQNVLRHLEGWSDPDGYEYPGVFTSIKEVCPYEWWPILKKAEKVTRYLQYPNGKHIAVQDTHPSSVESERGAEYQDHLWLPAAKIARVTGGPSNGVPHVTMSCAPKYGHSHFDALSITMFSKNTELLPELGYTHTELRSFATSTIAHNTVTVDGMDSKDNPHGGAFVAFVPTTKFAGMIRAKDAACYEQTDVYDRQIITMPFPSFDAFGYMVDIFRVQGGKRHEYTCHMMPDCDTLWTSDIAFQGKQDTMLPQGTPYRLPNGELDRGESHGRYYAYMHINHVQSTPLYGNSYTVTCQEKTPNPVGLRMIGTKTDGVLYAGQSPSLYEQRQCTDGKLTEKPDKKRMQTFITRRAPHDGQSVFIHLFEPFCGLDVKRVQKPVRLDTKTHWADVALKIETIDGVDYIFSAYDRPMSFSADGIDFHGRFGVVRMQNRKPTAMQVMDASVQVCDGTGVAAASVYGRVVDVSYECSDRMDNGFWVSLDSHLKDDCMATRAIITLSNGWTFGYAIDDIILQGDRHFVRIGDENPGFTVGENGLVMTHFPFLELQGEVRIEIVGEAFWFDHTIQSSKRRPI